MRTPILPLALLAATFLPACSSAGTGESGPPYDWDARSITYRAGETELEGYLALPRGLGATTPVPGVLVIHEWWGHNEYARSRAVQLAQLGYAALAVDMYGGGRNTGHPADAQAFMQEAMGEPGAVEARFRAGLERLHAEPGVDGSRTAAIGYCMGGAIALNMARAGADLDAVASFHGSLGTETPAAPGAIQAKLLVATGADDSFVPPEQVEAFEAEMQASGADFEVVRYPGVVHGFTNPAATAKGEEFELPLRYDEQADQDSWERMKALFADAFGA